MKLAKEAVSYYVDVTGNTWSSFYDKLDDAMAGRLEEQTGDLWLIHALMDVVVKNGMSVHDFKSNKDAVKAVFDDAGRKLNGEFFTPVIWAEEFHRYLDKYIPNWREVYYVWENSCYDMETEVYTKRGWLKFDQLEPDDQIYTFNRESSLAEWSGYHNLFKRVYNGKMVHFLGKDVDLLVTPEHQMLYWKGDGYAMTSASTLHQILSMSQPHGVELLIGMCCDEKCRAQDHPDTVSSVLTPALKRKDVIFQSEDVHEMREVETVAISLGLTCNLRKDGSLHIFNTMHSVVHYDTSRYEDYKGEVWDLTTNNDNHVFLVRRNGMMVFSGNCGTGNLIRTAGITPDHLFASSLQADDIEVIRKTPELAGCHAFQLDFLCEADNLDTGFDLFSENLPEDVLSVLQGNKPLIFLCNPPYKTGQANNTAVGKYMSCNINEYDNVNFAKPAYDLFYQFCFQVMNIVNRYGLTNCYYAVFGPLTWFTGAGANILLREFEKTFEFVDGMCISAQEFSDTSDSILWGIGATIWKSRGRYKPFGDDFQYHKDILLDKKFITPDGDIDCEGKVLYAPPREKLSAWVEPHDDALGVAGQRFYPLMTSHLTFKGSEVFEKVAKKSGKMSPLAMGTLMVGNTLTRSADQSAILSMPTTIQFVSITEENFWRCVGSYAFRRTIDAGWAIAKKEISAPDTTVEGYDLWLRNALVAFLFEYKSMMSSLRGVVWEGQDDYVIQNKLFFLSEDTVRQNCTDPVILSDMEKYPFQNQFILKMIEESKPFWVPETRMVYDWCVDYTLSTFDQRKTVGYKGGLECADAGFQQLRSGLWDTKYDADLTKLIVQMRDYLRKDLEKFGFVSEVCGGDI